MSKIRTLIASITLALVASIGATVTLPAATVEAAPYNCSAWWNSAKTRGYARCWNGTGWVRAKVYCRSADGMSLSTHLGPKKSPGSTSFADCRSGFYVYGVTVLTGD